MTTPQNIDGLINAALEISDEWCDSLRRLREAFERGDEKEALQIARQLCGFEDEKKPRKNQKAKLKEHH